MKTGKAIVIAAAMLFTTAAVHAQSMKNMIKIGVLGGASVPSNNAAASAGLDVAYQNLVTPHFGLGVATGYQHHFGKENDLNGATLDNNSFGVVPVAALVRYYPKEEGIYIGTDVGYGVITGDEKVASNNAAVRPNGGFYLKPEVGYHNRNWNIFAHYSKVFNGDDGLIQVGNESQKYNTGIIGVGLAYNIGLGAGR
ncbi:hypothetical protein [Niabella ginsengisoli]|uniref:Outer membrane protein beta-barrel domain-containing protein n=1 Tax=Niabella ginsengisoli TaxID=522298 RepID=A0ABS9SFM1_9BACT|nr:hypothetical protein [Niabella ginsengisoli]MCH5597161.1 hypothetical protein [Niabella ginsengisoli]